MSSSVPSKRSKVARADPLIGVVIGGKYRILALVAKGGMGKIYQAEQQPLGRIVALKLLHVATRREGSDTQDSDAEVSEKRFFREASILAKLQHPNIVTVYDFGSVDLAESAPNPRGVAAATVRERGLAAPGPIETVREGPFVDKAHQGRESDDRDESEAPEARRFFMAMEFLVGETLHDRLHARKNLSAEETVRFARQVARGLREAHALGIVHRDLKPLNLMIVTDRDGDEQIKILDFGIVKVVEGLGTPAQELTEEGLFVGSPMYMAPEQIETGRVDARSDVYSLGVVIYRCLAGQTPFPNGSTMQIMMAHLSEPPAPLHQRAPEAPEWLDQLVHRCLDKDPKKRPQSMDELLRILNEHALTSGGVGALGVSSGNITLQSQANRPSFSGLRPGSILPPIDEHTVASGSSPTLTRASALSAPRMPSSTSPLAPKRRPSWVVAVVCLLFVGLGTGGTLLAIHGQGSRATGGDEGAPRSSNGAAKTHATTSSAQTLASSATSDASTSASTNASALASANVSTSASTTLTNPSPTLLPTATNKPWVKPTISASTKPSTAPTLDINFKR